MNIKGESINIQELKSNLLILLEIVNFINIK